MYIFFSQKSFWKTNSNNGRSRSEANVNNWGACKKQTEALQTLELNDQEPRNKIFNDLVRERTEEIGELEEKYYHDQLIFVTIWRLYMILIDKENQGYCLIT